MNKILLALLLCFSLAAVNLANAETSIDLSGSWSFQFADKAEPGRIPIVYTDTISLPGTTSTAKKGVKRQRGRDSGWFDPFEYRGKAWYQRQIEIPPTWAGKQLTLFLERARPSRVWVDGAEIMSVCQTLVTPHIYDLSALKPGKHQLTVQIDSGAQIPIGYGHEAVLQGYWNGIIGRIELQETDNVWIERLRLTPDLAANVTHVEVFIGNRTGQNQDAVLTLSAQGVGAETSHVTGVVKQSFAVAGESAVVKLDLPMGKDAPRWDEFNPALFELNASLQAGACADAQRVTFGFREFKRVGNRITLNGHPVFLRGTHDAEVWPDTGCPPMTVAGWRKYFTQCKEWGLNFIRFHSNTPPDAAFQLADELGICLQPEVHWFGVNPKGKAQMDYALMVAAQMDDWFGNHPSFALTTFGNEGGGNDQETMTAMVKAGKSHDPRPLRANITNNQSPWGYTDLDDFHNSVSTKGHPGKGFLTRGSAAYGMQNGGHVTAGPPNTMFDYDNAVAEESLPMIGHEVGQYQSYPNDDEIPEYTGVMQVENLREFQRRLQAAGMADQWRDFFHASAKLALINYREDIESFLRTSNYNGFVLLDIKDYPGQGTALVGLWDAHLNNKGAITPPAWREFCCETVPLLRFEKYTWTTAERFSAGVQVFDYAPADWTGEITWQLSDAQGRVLQSGSLGRQTLKTSRLNTVGQLAFPLDKIAAPRKVELLVELKGTQYRNRYPLWIYPAQINSTPPATVTMARQFDDSVRAKLQAGGSVLLYPQARDLPDTVRGIFLADFWNFDMFNRVAVMRGVGLPPGTLGLLIQEHSPALAEFPTGFYSDYQWWHIIDQARDIVLDDTPKSFRPIVQVIDNVSRNHKLGLIWEAKVGAGRLLVCSSPLPDMLKDYPEARQLNRSLLDYAASPAFQPKDSLNLDLCTALLNPMHNQASDAVATASSSVDGFGPELAVDGRLDTYWLAKSSAQLDPFEKVVEGRVVVKKADNHVPEFLQLDFKQPITINGLRIHWLSTFNYPYQVEVSVDGKTWQVISDQTKNQFRSMTHDLPEAKAAGVRYLRILCGEPQVGKPAIRQVEVF